MEVRHGGDVGADGREFFLIAREVVYRLGRIDIFLFLGWLHDGIGIELGLCHIGFVLCKRIFVHLDRRGRFYFGHLVILWCHAHHAEAGQWIV